MLEEEAALVLERFWFGSAQSPPAPPARGVVDP